MLLLFCWKLSIFLLLVHDVPIWTDSWGLRHPFRRYCRC
jgi:hypothetical protein